MSKLTYDSMSMDELVTAWNIMVDNPKVKELGNRRYQPVQKFSDYTTAVTRCKGLESTIRALSAVKSRKEEEEAPTEETAANTESLNDRTSEAKESEEGVEENAEPKKPEEASDENVAEDPETEDEEMAEKVKRKTRTAKAKKAKTTKRAARAASSNGGNGREPYVGKNKIIEQFQPRAGTVREKVLEVLTENYKQPVSIKSLLKVAYGSQDMENTSALKMVFGGVNHMIEVHKLDMELRREGRGEEATYGLYPTSD